MHFKLETVAVSVRGDGDTASSIAISQSLYKGTKDVSHTTTNAAVVDCRQRTMTKVRQLGQSTTTAPIPTL